LNALISDIQLSVRRLRRRPAFTAVIVLSLALGIGANALIFSLAFALLRGATPYPYPERVMAIWFTPPNEPGARTLATDANCAALRERLRSLRSIGCVRTEAATTLSAPPGDASGFDAPPVRVSGQEFTAGVAETLGVPAHLGRWFTREEERRTDAVMVISHRLWQQRFGGVGDIVGRQVRATNPALTSEVVTIIGVAPPGFQLLDSRADFWFPLVMPRGAQASAARRLLVIGRLDPGITVRQVDAELEAAAAALSQETPSTNRGWGIRAEPISQVVRGAVGRPLGILQAVVGLVLLIACGNVAGLLLADGASRRGEMALRSALGASCARLVRQGLTGSFVTSLCGAALGLALTWYGLRVLAATMPPGVPGIDRLHLHPGVLVFTMVLAGLTTLLFGVAPAFSATRHGAADALKRFSRTAGGRAAGHRLGSAFVVAQIALAFVLSIGAMLMIRSLLQLQAVDPGVETGGVLTFQVSFDGRDYLRDTGQTTPSGATAIFVMPRLYDAAERVREAVAALPGVQAASAMAATAPLSGFTRRYGLDAPGREGASIGGSAMAADWFPVLADYFAALELPVLRGRAFNEADSAAGLPVAIVNASLAEELWPGADPIGRELQLRLFNEPRRQVIGIVPDVHHSTRQQGKPRHVYVPFAQVPPVQSSTVAQGLELLTFVVRTSGNAASLPQAFRGVVSRVAPMAPIVAVKPLEQYVTDQLEGFRQYTILLALFGGLALGLAILGAYGLMAHAVSQRVHEIGVRMALGATHGQALWMILRRGIVVTAAGLVIGAAAALGVTHVLEGYLWEVTATDPLTFAGVAILLATVSMVSSYAAARRALSIDPAAALREEAVEAW
jgi:putative ABC transport system permease protein